MVGQNVLSVKVCQIISFELWIKQKLFRFFISLNVYLFDTELELSVVFCMVNLRIFCTLHCFTSSAAPHSIHQHLAENLI